MKKIYKYLVIAVAIIIIVSIAIISRPKKVGTLNSPLATGINEAQAQIFASNKYPEIKDGDKMFGNAAAPLQIFVYEDYTNIYSAKLADTLDRIGAEFGDKVAIIIRPYFKNSLLASQAQTAVDCAGEQGKWIEMRALLFAQTKNNQLSAANFSAYAEQIGLNGSDFSGCLTKSQKSVKIEQSVQEAGNYVQGTPTIFVGSDMILGARPYEDFTDSNGDKIEGLKTVVERMIK
jgi:protein-disulfide isomerase